MFYGIYDVISIIINYLLPPSQSLSLSQFQSISLSLSLFITFAAVFSCPTIRTP